MVPLRNNAPAPSVPIDMDEAAGNVMEVSSPPVASAPFDACLPLVADSANANLFAKVPVHIAPLPIGPYSSTAAVLIRPTG